MKLINSIIAGAVVSLGVMIAPNSANAACPPTWVEIGDAPSTFPGQLTDCVIPSDNIGANITGTLNTKDIVDIFQVSLSQNSVAQGFIFGSSSMYMHPNTKIVFTAFDSSETIVGAPIVLQSPFPRSDFAFTEFSLNPGIYYLKVHGENLKSPISYQFQASFTPPSSDVPGPLGIAGIGAAYAYSRKLRNRIKI